MNQLKRTVIVAVDETDEWARKVMFEMVEGSPLETVRCFTAVALGRVYLGSISNQKKGRRINVLLLEKSEFSHIEPDFTIKTVRFGGSKYFAYKPDEKVFEIYPGNANRSGFKSTVTNQFAAYLLNTYG